MFQRKIGNLRVRYVSRKSNLGTCRAELPSDEKSDRGMLKIVLTHTMFKIRCLDMDIVRRSVFVKLRIQYVHTDAGLLISFKLYVTFVFYCVIYTMFYGLEISDRDKLSCT